MRAVFTVLVAAGNLKREFPQEDENVLMLRAILDVNLAKFLHFDIPLFNGIMKDLFPGLERPKIPYTELKQAIKEALEELNLQWNDHLIIKIIQLYEMICVRHGLMIVGEPYGGKSTSQKVLANALTRLA